jgi:murein DD-endopeptidase MepM/ murein hydrolase activator NlpD
MPIQNFILDRCGKDMKIEGITGRVNFEGDRPVAKVTVREAMIKKVSREMESLFLYELLKAMRRTIVTSSPMESGEGFQKETYTSLFDMELSRLLAERGTGLGDLIARELMKQGSEVRNQRSDVGNQKSESMEKFSLKSDIPYPTSDLPSYPLEGTLSSGFGMRLHPVTGTWRFHKGIDINAPEGTPVRAVMDGRVKFSGWLKGYGNTVIIEHSNGLETRYSHNRQNLVKVGDLVRQGEVIAEVGNSGISTGNHLHFEVLSQGKPIDPEGFLRIKDLKA